MFKHPGVVRSRPISWKVVSSLLVLSVLLAACGDSSAGTTPTGVAGAAATNTNAPMPTVAPSPTATLSPITSATVLPSTPTSLPMATALPTLAGSVALGTQTPAPSTETAASAPTGGRIAVGIVEPTTNFNSWTYDPGDLMVNVGDTVTWTNTGVAAHTVTPDDGTAFDSGTVKAGQTFSFTFTTPGTFPYHCTFHPWMTATITGVGS